MGRKLEHNKKKDSDRGNSLAWVWGGQRRPEKVTSDNRLEQNQAWKHLEKNIPNRGNKSAKALRQECDRTFEEQQKSPCGHNTVRGNGSELETKLDPQGS